VYVNIRRHQHTRVYSRPAAPRQSSGVSQTPLSTAAVRRQVLHTCHRRWPSSMVFIFLLYILVVSCAYNA